MGGSWGRLGVYLGRLRVCFGGVLRLGCVLGRLGGDLGVLGCLEGSWGHMGFGSRFREQFGVVNFGDVLGVGIASCAPSYPREYHFNALPVPLLTPRFLSE